MSDASLLRRIRDHLSDRSDVREISMMGGRVFMVSGHMCCGARDGHLMTRIGKAARDDALRQPHVSPLDIGNGRRPKAFVRVAMSGLESDEALRVWIDRALAFVEGLPPKES